MNYTEEQRKEIEKTMTDKERWEVDHNGDFFVGEPQSININQKEVLENLLNKNGWTCTVEKAKASFFKVNMKNDSINKSENLIIYLGNIGKDEKRRGKYAKRVQMNNCTYIQDIKEEKILIMGIYVSNEFDDINDAIIGAWPLDTIDSTSTSPRSLRIYMDKDIQKAKITGLHIDRESDKRTVTFRPEFIFYYIENYISLHNNSMHTRGGKRRTHTSISNIKKPHNRIIFGAPGTGKSFTISEDKKNIFDEKDCERVTFHPNYSYAQFVGAYKPIVKEKDDTTKEEFVSYEFVPGPFTRVLINSLNNENTPNLLIIEELNRANPAGVFGDVFQLLDRDSNGKSKYTINISEEMKKYICGKLNKQDMIDYIKKYGLYIPENMYIWTTMNSADQGVFPMDSAFKRRWSFEYLDIDAGENSLESKGCNKIKLKNGTAYGEYNWNKIRKHINSLLKESTLRINEDKLLGPFFLSEDELNLSQNDDTQEYFDSIFKSKLLMYLYEDVLKHKKSEILFSNGINSLSDLVKAYDNGKVFSFDINKFLYLDKNTSEENKTVILESENKDSVSEKDHKDDVLNQSSNEDNAIDSNEN